MSDQPSQCVMLASCDYLRTEARPISSTHPSAHDPTPDDDSDEEFVYPGATDVKAGAFPPEATVQSPMETKTNENPTSDPEPIPEREADGQPATLATIPSPTTAHPSPTQLEALYAAASSGDLRQLNNIFRDALDTAHIEPFALANDASARTGLTALHAAASRGYLDMVKWCESAFLASLIGVDLQLLLVVAECGAMPDLEDKEGEVSYIPSSQDMLSEPITILDCSAQSRAQWPSHRNPLPFTRESGRARSGCGWVDCSA